jgi:hypothetical protein
MTMRIRLSAPARRQIKCTGMLFKRNHLSRAGTAVTLDDMREAVKDFQVAVPREAVEDRSRNERSADNGWFLTIRHSTANDG